MRVYLMLLIISSLLLADGPWGDHDGIDQIKPWLSAKDVHEVLPWYLDSCTYGLDGTNLNGYRSGVSMMWLADIVIWDQLTMEQKAMATLRAHDSIEVCLQRLKKSSPDAFCKTECIYRECDWKRSEVRPLKYEYKCIRRYTDELLDCAEPEYMASCLLLIKEGL